MFVAFENKRMYYTTIISSFDQSTSENAYKEFRSLILLLVCFPFFKTIDSFPDLCLFIYKYFKDKLIFCNFQKLTLI